MKRSIAVVAGLFALAGAFLPSAAPSPAVSAAGAVASLERALKAVTTLQARFEQLYFSMSITEPLREKGDLFLQKPDRMRWTYKDPQDKTFLYKEGVLEMYLPEENQLTRSPVAVEALKSDIFGLFLGVMSFEEAYAVEDTPSRRKHCVPVADPRVEGDFNHPARHRRGDVAAPLNSGVGGEQARVRLGQIRPASVSRQDFHSWVPLARDHRRHGERQALGGAKPFGPRIV
jgi:outer membrane lipoprotein-sorting protein